MKKLLIVLLAMICALSAVLLVACNATEVSISIKDAPDTVEYGEEIDYSKISILVSYDRGQPREIKLTNSAVTYNEINVNKFGKQTLTVSYKGLQASAVIEVVLGIDAEEITIWSVDNTEGYKQYQNAIQTKTEKEEEFYNRDVVYTVGNDNGYVCLPQIQWEHNGEVQADNLPYVETTYQLFIWNDTAWELADTNVYLDGVNANVYYFTKQAENEKFKLVVTLDEGYNLITSNIKTTIEQVFVVVSGYNVYDALGLSVLDNRNVKSWATIKEQELDWDNGKKLNEFGDVKQVVIHNDITVTAEDLPDNYFWHVGDQAKREGSMSYTVAESIVPTTLKAYLPGSLKEAWLGEDWETQNDDTNQRGLYVSNGIGISGNCLTLSYYSNVNATDKGSKGIYIVHDYKQKTAGTNKQYPEAHYSFMLYTHEDPVLSVEEAEANIKGTRTIQNVYFKGETQKTDDVSNPAGIMMLSADIGGLQIINTISNQWFCNAQLDGVSVGSLKLKDCKFYESFSQMVFSWGIHSIDIEHCEMKRAGGPLLILQTLTNDKARDTVVNIDDVSNMESWLTGSETWFSINDVPANMVEQMFTAGSLTDLMGMGTHYKKGNQVNAIAIVIPAPGDVFKNQKSIPGTIKVGDTTYSMQNSVFETLTTLATDISTTGVALAETTLAAGKGLLSAQEEGLINQLKDGLASMQSNAQVVKLQVAPIYQCGDKYAIYNGSNLVNLNSVKNEQYMQLYGGIMTQVIPKIDQMIAGLSGEQKAQAEQLKAGWQALATKLGYVANLQIDDTSWTTGWNAGHLAFWVNPGGLGETPNLNLKHFMILFGENKVA